MQAGEKLKPTEVELRRMEEVIAEVVREMDYLREREQKLRDTNESTNERVKWFAIGTMGMLVGLGVWQIIYLRAYFRYGLSALFNFDNAPLLTTYPSTDRSTSYKNRCCVNATSTYYCSM